MQMNFLEQLKKTVYMYKTLILLYIYIIYDILKFLNFDFSMKIHFKYFKTILKMYTILVYS